MRWQGKGRFYEQVQQVLANPDDVTDEAIEVAVALAEHVVTHRLQSAYTVWRGTRSAVDAFGVTEDRLEELIGREGRLGRFTAGSLDRNIAADEFTNPQLRGGAVLMRMELRPGVRVGWLASIGDKRMAYQREVLLHPEMVQRIVGVDRSGLVPVVVMEVSAR